MDRSRLKTVLALGGYGLVIAGSQLRPLEGLGLRMGVENMKRGAKKPDGTVTFAVRRHPDTSIKRRTGLRADQRPSGVACSAPRKSSLAPIFIGSLSTVHDE